MLNKIKNYRPVSLLNIFSKIYERFLHENLTNYVDTFLSKFISTYRKSYSSNYALIHLIENWKKSLDQKENQIAKMHAYGFSIDAVTFFYSNSKRRKQNVRVNNTYSVF